MSFALFVTPCSFFFFSTLKLFSYVKMQNLFTLIILQNFQFQKDLSTSLQLIVVKRYHIHSARGAILGATLPVGANV